METVVLVVLLILALVLIGVVLLQRNEGGGLGMGTAGVMTGRGQATALARATWWLGGAFMLACLAMTIIAAENAGGSSVVDQLRSSPGAAEDATDADETGTPGLPGLDGGSLLPPVAGDAPLVPADDLGLPDPAAPAPEAATPAAPAAAPEGAPAAD